METFIRRVLLGFNRDREDSRTTISLYLNIFLIAARKTLRNLTFSGVVMSVAYWLGYVTLANSPAVGTKLAAWGVYSPDSRDIAAKLALIVLCCAGVLYVNRLYMLGKFAEETDDDLGVGLNASHLVPMAKIMRAEEEIVQRREGLYDQANKHT